MAETKKAKTTKNTTSTKTRESKEIESLKKQVAEAMDLINQLTQAKEATVSTSKSAKIDGDDTIPVISQCAHRLSLSTEGYGRGIVYDFDELGEVQDVPFSDLKDIVRHNKTFVKRGLFYIMDDQAVKQLRLTSLYKKLLSSNDVIQLLAKDDKTIIELYKLAPEEQKSTIIDMVIDEKTSGKNISINVLAELGSLCNKDLINIKSE